MRQTFKQMFGTLTPWGRFWLYLGLGSLLAATAMSFDFGWGVSVKHALFLACLSVVTAFAPEAAYTQWERGRKGVALTLAALCVPLFAIEFFSHAGYTAGLRGVNVTEARVQNARYDGAQDILADERTNLAMWREQLAKLKSEQAWVATVSADGLRANLTAADEAIKQETKRGGCGPKCLALMKSKATLEERIALAEQRDDLTKRIEATQRILDTKTATAAKVEHKTSSVAEQNAFIIKAAAMAIEGELKASDFLAEGAQQTVNLGMALAGTGLPALALFIAGLYRREGESHDIEITQITEAPHTLPSRPVPPTGAAIPPSRSPVGFLDSVVSAARDTIARPSAVWSHG